MEYLLIIFLEGITMLLWLHIGFRKAFKIDVEKVCFLALYTAYYYIATICRTGFWTSMLGVVILLIWSVVYLGEKKPYSVVRYIIGILGVGLTQIVSLEIFDLFIEDKNVIITNANYVRVNLLCVLLSTLAYYIFVNKSLRLSKPGKFAVAVLIYIACIMMFIKYDYEQHGQAYSELYIYLFGLLVLFVAVVVRELVIKHELEQKRLELEIKERYEDTYSKLLLEMRRKQHDYKNQISALYSMKIVGDTEDESWKLQKEYGDELLKATEFDELLLNTTNPVLAGYMYTRCNEAMRLGIKIEPIVGCSKKNYNIQLHEVIEIVGILINNAIEYLSVNEFDYKKIRVHIYDKEDRLIIDVANIAEYQPYEIIEKMFSPGYSTKGNDRGIGLYSLKTLVLKNKGEILVENQEKHDSNWLRIRVTV